MSFGLWYSAPGQGTVNFATGAFAATQITTNAVYGGPSVGLISGPIGSYYFALFVAPSTVTVNWSPDDPTLAGFTFTGAIGTNTATAGRFSGNNLTTPSVGVAVAGYAAGTTASFTVVGWSVNYGATWADALAARNTDKFGYWGSSGVAEVQLGGGAIPAGTIFGLNLGQIPGFALNPGPIPEPQVSALGGLGLLMLLGLRRKGYR